MTRLTCSMIRWAYTCTDICQIRLATSVRRLGTYNDVLDGLSAVRSLSSHFHAVFNMLLSVEPTIGVNLS